MVRTRRLGKRRTGICRNQIRSSHRHYSGVHIGLHLRSPVCATEPVLGLSWRKSVAAKILAYEVVLSMSYITVLTRLLYGSFGG
jgi:hypothetical protein